VLAAALRALTPRTVAATPLVDVVADVAVVVAGAVVAVP